MKVLILVHCVKRNTVYSAAAAALACFEPLKPMTEAHSVAEHVFNMSRSISFSEYKVDEGDQRNEQISIFNFALIKYF